MKKYILPILLLFGINSYSQILNVPVNIQEENQWCWAGVSKSILDYYNFSQTQCTIAEYTRQNSTWHDFGADNCCSNPNGECNYWNYLYGYSGSIQFIIQNFGNINATGIYNDLTLADISTEIANGRPFVVRWGWDTGGGHFVLGHGISGNDITYMNPWFGEGRHVADYTWLQDDGHHTWTHTLKLTTNPASINQENNDVFLVYPNPSNSIIQIKSKKTIDNIKIYNLANQLIINSNNTKKINISKLKKGIYLIRIQQKKKMFYTKFIKD